MTIPCWKQREAALLETFVYSEVIKQSSWSEENHTIHHYRDKDQEEVDLIVKTNKVL